MAELHIRLPESTKSDFQSLLSKLGYRSTSEGLRDMIDKMTYGGEKTPKEQFLSRQLLRLKESLVTPEEAEKLREDFLAFLKEYHYLIYFTKITADQFWQQMELEDTDSMLYKQFYHMHGYSITPTEAYQLVKHIPHDADCVNEIRGLMNQMMAVKVQTADIQDILSPSEKLAIAEGGRK